MSELKNDKDLLQFEIKSVKRKLVELTNNYFFYYITDKKINISYIRNINQCMQQSKVLVINTFTDIKDKDMFFILGFKKSIIIIKESLLFVLKKILTIKTDLPIYFLTNTKDIFQQQIGIENEQIKYDKFLYYEIYNFNKEILAFKQKEGNSFNQMRLNILSCITGFLIRESYELYEDENDFIYINQIFGNNVLKVNLSIKDFDENDYVELRNIGFGASFTVSLIYMIENGMLCAIKKPRGSSNETIKLLDRENKNYSQINYPLVPKYYGKVRGTKYPIFQFIDGQTLKDVNKDLLSENDKIIIIFELMLIINYLHENGFVYRDLKPDNIMINKDKNAFIIDLDRMIKISDKSADEAYTVDFQSDFVAPEVNNGQYSYKSDIYSIGKIIYYMMAESIDKKQINNVNLSNIYKRCVNDPKQRPLISELIFEFYVIFSSNMDNLFVSNFNEVKYFQGIINYDPEYINLDVDKSIQYLTLAANQNIPQSQFILGVFYLDARHVKRNINKSIDYFSLAANQNHSDAQYNLGVMYLNGKYVATNIEKSLHYLYLAANQNNKKAQYCLGTLYCEGRLVPQDINKAIHFYTLSANQNMMISQYNLGVIYSNDKYGIHDIKKAIYYYTLAANQNHSDAQKYLGALYYDGKYIERDINKAIYYYSLASNQNNSEAQFELGLIYFENKYIKQDINKSIHFWSLAANQNHLDAQNYLGALYYDGKYIERDINKAIYYYSLASNQNDSEAQYNLALFFYEGKYISRDINKVLFNTCCKSK